MTGSPVPDGLAAECRAFARHLSDAAPTPYVLECYARLAPGAAHPLPVATEMIERMLLWMGRSGGVKLRMADGYACIARPRSELRRRLILLVAIMENSPSTSAQFNTADEGSLLVVGARMTGAMVVSVLCTAAGIAVIGPVHVASALLAPVRRLARARP